MAYQKLQTQRAIAVIPNDSGTVIPSPGGEIFSGLSGIVTSSFKLDAYGSQNFSKSSTGGCGV